MKPVVLSEVLPLGAYEEVREAFRRRIIELKRVRRISVGPNITILFENHDTALYQIQEMLRTERITREDAVMHEIETYNDLVPAENQLVLTLFIEYPEREERERMLVALAGLEKTLGFEVDGEPQGIVPDTHGVMTDRTTAVQYLKIALSEAAVRAIRGGKARVAFTVGHPAYEARAELPPRTVEELAADLSS